MNKKKLQAFKREKFQKLALNNLSGGHGHAGNSGLTWHVKLDPTWYGANGDTVEEWYGDQCGK